MTFGSHNFFLFLFLQNSVGELNEMDSYPWKDSISNYNPPLNPAPGEYPSPRKKCMFNVEICLSVRSTNLLFVLYANM